MTGNKYTELQTLHEQLHASDKLVLKNIGHGVTPKRADHIFSKSSAQVETLVVAKPLPKSCELKLKRKRAILSVEFTEQQRSDICDKARKANLSVNAYIKVSTLGSHYKPPIDPALHEALFALNRELTAQGRNLNQIAKHLNGGTATPSQGVALLEAIRRPLIGALRAVKNALVQGRPMP